MFARTEPACLDVAAAPEYPVPGLDRPGPCITLQPLKCLPGRVRRRRARCQHSFEWLDTGRFILDDVYGEGVQLGQKGSCPRRLQTYRAASSAATTARNTHLLVTTARRRAWKWPRHVRVIKSEKCVVDFGIFATFNRMIVEGASYSQASSPHVDPLPMRSQQSTISRQGMLALHRRA